MVATSETDSHGLPAGWNGRGAAIPSLSEHLHPQQILVGPDDFEELILRLIIPKVVNPVQKSTGHMKHARLRSLEQKNSSHLETELMVFGKFIKRLTG